MSDENKREVNKSDTSDDAAKFWNVLFPNFDKDARALLENDTSNEAALRFFQLFPKVLNPEPLTREEYDGLVMWREAARRAELKIAELQGEKKRHNEMYEKEIASRDEEIEHMHKEIAELQAQSEDKKREHQLLMRAAYINGAEMSSHYFGIEHEPPSLERIESEFDKWRTEL